MEKLATVPELTVPEPALSEPIKQTVHIPVWIPPESGDSPGHPQRDGERPALFRRAALPGAAIILMALALLAIGFGWPQGGDLAAFAIALCLAAYLFRAFPASFFLVSFLSSAVAIFLLLRGGQPTAFAIGEPLVLTACAAGIWARLHIEWRETRRSMQDLRLEVHELRQISMRDPLTGLFNRRFAFETGKSLASQARRYGGDLHLIMIDLDHFKRINDTWGHPAGDEVLKGLAGLLIHVLRQADVAARIGGEEFLVILPRTGAEAAYNIANRIRDGLGECSFPGIHRRVTASLGVTGLQTEDDFETAFARADACLYHSKHSGRNRVTVG